MRLVCYAPLKKKLIQFLISVNSRYRDQDILAEPAYEALNQAFFVRLPRITELRLGCIVRYELTEVLIQFAHILAPAILDSCARIVIDQAPRYTTKELKHLDVPFQ